MEENEKKMLLMDIFHVKRSIPKMLRTGKRERENEEPKNMISIP